MKAPFAAPITPPERVASALVEQGHAVLDPAGFAALVDAPLTAFDAMRPAWDDLPPDTYLRDGGHYRRRRHSCFVVRGEAVEPVPHRAHWQPVEYNALHGGLERWFEPIAPGIVAREAWQRLLAAMGRLASALRGDRPWFAEAHQFRIDTTDGIGRPTPEGVVIELRLSHQELASAIGSTRESVTLMMGELTDEGLVGKRRSRIILCATEMLRKQVAGDAKERHKSNRRTDSRG